MEKMMKIEKEYGEVKKIKIDEGDSMNQIFYIKYNEEKTAWDKRPVKNNRDNHNRGDENTYERGSRERTHL